MKKNKLILDLDKVLGKAVFIKKTKGVEISKINLNKWANGPRMVIETNFSFSENNLRKTLIILLTYLKEKIKISEMNMKFIKKYNFIYHPNVLFVEKLEYKNLKNIQKSISKFIKKY